MNVRRNSEGVKRPYHSPRRESQARATQQAILEAAHELFLANGYAGTSIDAIAERAEVARQTVYDNFGDKASLLYAVAERVVARQDDPAPLGESRAWAELANEPDPRARIRMAAHLSREAWEAGMVEFETMIFDTAASDTKLRDLARDAVRGKRQDAEAVIEIVLPPDVIRPGVSRDEILDLIVAIDSAAVVRTLTEELGWTYDQYEHWLAKILERLFLKE